MRILMMIIFGVYVVPAQAFQLNIASSIQGVESQMRALDAAVRAACPDIDGVNSNGVVAFKSNASDACKTAGNAAAQTFVPIQ